MVMTTWLYKKIFLVQSHCEHHMAPIIGKGTCCLHSKRKGCWLK